jgi:peptidoglycan/xylan/chitin deacetylase (PgdA/CDA1 family)
MSEQSEGTYAAEVAVGAILADGREVGHHGYPHWSPAGLSAAEEASS